MTRKPVIRDPLPEKDLITLCELVTWLAIGKAWPARRLKGLMKRNRGRKPAFLWASFEKAAGTVVSLCRKNDLSPAGSVDGNPRQPFPEGYFLSDIYADYVSDSIGPDLLAWPSASPYPDEHDEEPKELPTYYGVQFFRSDVLSTGQADQPAAETAQAPAGGAQDDAALALEMVSARGTEVKPATPAVPPLDSVNLIGAERAAAPRTKAATNKMFVDLHQEFLDNNPRPATVKESIALGRSIGVGRDDARVLRRGLPSHLKNQRRRPFHK